jgi:hypothetical protein
VGGQFGVALQHGLIIFVAYPPPHGLFAKSTSAALEQVGDSLEEAAWPARATGRR